MYNITTDKPVLVTGATGFIAGWIIKDLLEAGARVHAAVRNLDDTVKINPLVKIADNTPGSIKFFRTNLLEKGSYDEAVKGCTTVFHTASPFLLQFKDPKHDLIAPAFEGTRNVLGSINKTKTVRRVVLTSSCAAICGDACDCARAPYGLLDESLWNQSSSATHLPYSYSKTIAEQTAWEIANAQNHWRLVVINPAFVFGPTLSGRSTSGTHDFLIQLGKGKFKTGLPALEIGTVDVRDVAQAHIAAAYLKNATGRYIVSNKVLSFLNIAQILKANFGENWPFPTRILPKWFIWLFGPFFDQNFTRKVIARNVGYRWRADNTKAIKDFGLIYRPIEQTIVDSFKQMVGENMF